MRRFFIVLALFSSSNYVYATNLNITHNDEPEKQLKLKDNSSVVLQENGDINLETESSIYSIVSDIGGSGELSIAFYPNKYFIADNEDIIVSWVVTNASSCRSRISGSQSNRSSWTSSTTKSSSDISNESSPHTEVVSVNTFPATLILECEDQNSVTSQRSFIIKESDTVSQPVTINMSVNNDSNSPINIVGEQVVNVEWDSTNAATCIASSNSIPALSNWNGDVGANSGSQGIDINIDKDIELYLSCGNESETYVINFDEDTVDPNCVGINTPTGYQIDERDYFVMNGNHNFGDVTHSASINLTFPFTGIVAAKNFRILTPDFTRTMTFISAGTGFEASSSWDTMSISTCPADFNPSTAVCVKDAIPFRNVQFSTDPNDEGSPLYDCVVEPGKSYYFNIIHTRDPFNGEPECELENPATCTIKIVEG